VKGGEAAKPSTPTGKAEKRFRVEDLVIRGGKLHASLTTPLGNKAFDAALPDIHLQNLGKEGQGLTSTELTKEIMNAVLAAAMKSAGDASTGLTKDLKNPLGKDPAQAVDKAAKGLKDLFKK
jgi:hypothetical protein